MARESVKRKPAQRLVRRRERYVPDWQPLRAKWDQLEAERHFSQKAMALAAKATEGAISQFLKGDTKLTVEWALQFATYMRLSPMEIWPDWPFPGISSGTLSPEEIEVAILYRMVKDPDQKISFAKLLRSLSKGG